jgi:hypothetical protein
MLSDCCANSTCEVEKLRERHCYFLSSSARVLREAARERRAAAIPPGSVLVSFSAGGGLASKAMIEKSGLANEAYSEPCMNGGVSASGLFHSQPEEDKAMSRMIIHSQADS